MTIGNVTVYRDNSRGDEVSVTLDNTYLSSLLDYDSFDEQTIPLRLGMFNASYILNQTLNADVYSVTDLSGSMKCDVFNEIIGCHVSRYRCQTLCGGTWFLPIDNAKSANIQFIDSVLIFSNNNVSLKAEVNSWLPDGNTCICCGINKAVDDLNLYSSSEKYRSIVVMSDGVAN